MLEREMLRVHFFNTHSMLIKEPCLHHPSIQMYHKINWFLTDINGQVFVDWIQKSKDENKANPTFQPSIKTQ